MQFIFNNYIFNYKINFIIIWCSFITSIILQIIQLSFNLLGYCVSWLNLLLIYWAILVPNMINVGTGFILGIIMDLIFGYTLGSHALVLVIGIFLINKKFTLLKNIFFWKNFIKLFILFFIINFILYFIKFVLINVVILQLILYHSMMDVFSFIFLSLIMHKAINFKTNIEKII